MTGGFEALFWLLIWVGGAAVLAFKVSGKAFLNGMATGALAAALHSLLLYALFDTYIAHNPKLLEGPPLPGGAELRTFQLMLMPLMALFNALFMGLMTLMAWKVVMLLRQHRQEHAE